MAEQGARAAAAPAPNSSAGALLPPPPIFLGENRGLIGHLGALGKHGLLGPLWKHGLLGPLWRRRHSIALSRSWHWAWVGRERRRAERTANGGGLKEPQTATGWKNRKRRRAERTADDGGLVQARGRTLSRHRRIPSCHLSPVVSGRSTGRWKLAPCQNSERMVASSNAVAAASLQNYCEYSPSGRSRQARAQNRAVVSIAAKGKTLTLSANSYRFYLHYVKIARFSAIYTTYCK